MPRAQRTTLKPHLPIQLWLCHGHCAFSIAASQQTSPSPGKTWGQSECRDQPHAYQMTALLVFTYEKGSWPSGTEIQINQNRFSASEVSATF